jgi:hypothetical protein
MSLDKKTLWGLYPFIQKYGKTTITATGTPADNTNNATTFKELITAFKNTNLQSHRDFYWLRKALALENIDGSTAAKLKPHINKLISYLERQKKTVGSQTFLFRDITIPDAVGTASAANNKTALDLLRTIWIDNFKIGQ